MATTTRKIIRMVFNTQNGRTFAITLPGPREDLTPAEVGTVMDLIITKNIIESTSGDLTGKRDIKIVDTATTDLYTPPGT